jgi:hypothetical protein
VTPRLNPAAPTFEAHSSSSFLTSPQEETHVGSSSISINTDTSLASSAHSLESAPKDSILSRISALSKKGSTSKFNISSAWKKDGGFFSRRSNKDGDADDGEDSSSSLNPNPSPLPWKDKAGFFGRGKRADEDDDEDLSTASLAKESSPWGKSQGAGFFGTIGRKRPIPADKDREDPPAPANTANQKENQSQKEGLQGIFGWKKDREEGKVTEVI